MLALGPRNLFDLDPAPDTINSSNRVRKVHRNVVDRHEFEKSGLGHVVVAGAGLSASRALRLASLACAHIGDNA